MQILFFLAAVQLFSLPAHAYIDPGTTGTVFGAIGAVLGPIIVFIGLLLRPIKNLILKIWQKMNGTKKETETTPEEQRDA